MRACKNLISFTLAVTLSSCYLHRSFVASPYEPLLVEKKGQVQIGAGLRPFKYVSTDLTYAPIDHLALRASGGFYKGLANFTGSMLYYNNWKPVNLFVGPLFNFQDNEINMKNAAFSLTHHARYSCRYSSPGGCNRL